ncbi:hypothetical protein SBOR_4423 [Sclerotinia borealis F-4128]|uniref:Cytochrome P450 n=1 Tax=Sclerotinia borealis (strain F-4128) TaxID=1432307 RepID=W9CEK1_SCLBF|nr:hypothetical protein SBOR_4423 [Sclerotinia borealis F-4128]
MELLWERMANGGDSAEKPVDMLQWMLDSTRKKTPQMIERLAQHTMLFFFAGANAPPMLLSFALMNLCKYPEYLEPLREEIMRLEHEPENEAKYDSMILMDSFLKETSRLQPLLSFTMARKVLKPFTFADGTHVPKDIWICAPQHIMNLDEANYSSPNTFDPFRFVPSTKASVDEVHASRFTTPSHNFLYWSGPKRPWEDSLHFQSRLSLILPMLRCDLSPRFLDVKVTKY